MDSVLTFNLDHFVDQCRAALSEPKPERAVEELVKAAVAAPGAIRGAFAASASAERQGPITFACRDATLSVADVTTSPGLRSPAHDHQMWAVIGVYDGQEHNRFFREREGGPEEVGERLLKAGDVIVLAPEAIHAIANPLPTVSGAIHVYGGDLVARPGRSLWNPDTNEREDYEMERLVKYVAAMSESP